AGGHGQGYRQHGVSSSNATIYPATPGTDDYGGNDAVLSVSLTMTSSSGFTYDITRDSEQGEQGTLFAGTVSGLTEAPTGFRFYNAATDSGAAQNNLYFNNLNVIPEPGAAILFLTGLGFIYFLRKRG
nr:PEP-CTERM sorting domain-containing protein [Kiritimatiellia bacterium]